MTQEEFEKIGHDKIHIYLINKYIADETAKTGKEFIKDLQEYINQNSLDMTKIKIENDKCITEQDNFNKYGLDKGLAKVIVEENTKNAKELNKDIDNYLDENGIINNFNTSTINLIDHYYKFLIAHPNEWVVISSVNNPTEKNSNEILFKIIDKFKSKEINFEKSYNKIRIIK